MRFTRIQVDTVDFISSYIGKHGYSPTMQEIADHFGVTKTSIHERIHALIKQGVIANERNKTRSITLLNEPDTCPLCRQKFKAAT